MQTVRNTIPLKPYSRRELAQIYGVCSRTLKLWIEPYENTVGPLRGRYYTILQVTKIFEVLGLPGIIILE